MHAAFGTIVVVVCVVAIVIAVVALASSNRTWSEHGKGGLIMERDLPRGAAAGAPSATAERDSEIRALLEARNARRARRGEPPLDVEAELARLTAPDDVTASGLPAVDAELREEIRQLVVARNHRRVRAGEPPLDVEAEVERELRKVADL
ncbi:MAG TPA: hypothetical protein VE992_06110 [Solirubrobacteraceae bacterium]|nr:hypothetical protein [Solirubrobacteraceae bacterium]